MKKEKPKTTPFFKFYVRIIISLLEDLFEGFIDLAICIYLGIIGGWYCEKCQKYHGRRIDKKILLYHFGESKIAVCSLGYGTPEGIKEVSDRIAKEHKELSYFQTASIKEQLLR